MFVTLCSRSNKVVYSVKDKEDKNWEMKNMFP